MRSEPARVRHKRLRLPLLLFAGAVLAIQVGWLISSPPFTQMDGVDHAYRAASVAHGHFTDQGTSPDARGNLIWVPKAMVDAAQNACKHLDYMKSGNCSALSAPNSDGDVLVGSRAATYNPAYYLVVGIPAVTLAPHSGTAMLLIIRIITMLWCDALIAAAVLITARLGRSLWPTLGIMMTAVPVPLCASVSAAPNGVQMAGGLLMWAAMCGLIFDDDSTPRRRRWLLGLWVLGSCCVLFTHSTGPFWFGVSFLIGLALLGRRRALALYRTQRISVLVSVGVVAVVGGLSLAWTVFEGTNIPGTLSGTQTAHLSDYLGQPLMWLLQCIGNVPFRNNFAPPIVYLVGLALIICIVVAALRQCYRAGRWAIVAVIVIALAISETLNFLTFATQGNAWQGRYTLALTYGVPVLSGWIIGTRSSARRPRGATDRLLATSIGVALGLMNAVTLINIWNVVNRPAWPADHAWDAPPTWLVVGLGCLAAVLMTAATERLAQRVSLNERDDRVLL